jgi:acylphosphatase
VKANVTILASGVVQGVGFRFFLDRKAREYGLCGWVRNLPRGEVEIEVEGEKGMIEDFIKEIKIGPRMASVAGIVVRWNESLKDYKDFRIKF